MTGVPRPTPTVTEPTRPPRVRLGTRMVRDRLGADPHALLARHEADEVLAALAALVTSTATRLDFFDEDTARDVARAAADAARAAADPDAHLGLGDAWSFVASRAPRIEVGQARIGELTQSLNAVLATYTRALAATGAGGTPSPTG
ncbi:hypothetical protein OG216_34880 [Streptomycetaceae bacterium NBC_01309]